ncbi:ABC transporter permease [Anaerosporobacter sp.]|uniref:ABC transporter permease n=1 Tax=Anaerosporobacter sp. TaxID=1872529 RepID=UPI00286EED42|nr:FtsX-like permease family protein [Anaerosporobacter sp.]
MYKVSNHKAIRNLAVKTIKANKKKNIAIIAAILLTTVMFTALFSIGMSLIESTQKSTMRQVGGKSMSGLKYGLEQDYEVLSKDAKIKEISYRIIVGILQSPELDSLPTEVYYATDDNAKNLFAYPEVGKMPEAEDEVALSALVLEKLGISKELGQTVSLDIVVGNSVYSKDFTLCGYWSGDSISMSQMCYVSKEYQEEVAPKPEDIYEAIQVTGYWMIDFDFYNSFNIEGKTIALLERNGYDLSKVGYGINWAYSFSNIDIQTIFLLIVILILILLAGYLIIYNIFYINVTSDIHEYGLLKTIGTSGKQLKRIVRMQATFLAVVGIPLGLLLGTIISKFIFPYIVDNMSLSKVDMVISVHPFIYLFACIFSMLTVVIGCRKPCKIAGNVSPIEAVSYTEWNMSRKKSKSARKVTTFQLAFSNLKRDKKKVVVVILSLSLSILLVNGLYSVIHSLDADKYISQSIIGDFSIQNAAVSNVQLRLGDEGVVGEDELAYLNSLDGVEEQSNIYCDLNALVTIDSNALSMIEELKQGKNASRCVEEINWMEESGVLRYDFYGIDNFALEQLELHSGTIDQEKFNSADYAIVFSYQLADGQRDSRFDMYNVGDKIEVTLSSGVTKTYEVMAIAELPYSMTTKSYKTIGGQIIVPSTEYLSNETSKGALVSILNVDDDKIEILNDTIQQFVDQTGSLTVVSKQSYMAEFNDFIKMIGIVGGALAIVLALIGILNFANAIITGIIRRSRELAMMEAVGMTKSQMTAMLVWEGMFYGGLTTLVAIVLHLFIGSPLINAVAGEIWFFDYHFTMVPILICLPFLIVLAGIIPFIAGKKMGERSVVERMKVS